MIGNNLNLSNQTAEVILEIVKLQYYDSVWEHCVAIYIPTIAIVLLGICIYVLYLTSKVK